jgi:TatD DNase family protein
MLIDTHCHLTDERFWDVKEVLRKAHEAGVEKVIMPSTSVEDAKLALAIAEKYGQYCLVGIHPEEVENLPKMNGGLSEIATPAARRDRNDNNEVMKEMGRIIKSSKRVVGVGEIGLDFYYDKERKTEQKQKELFRIQVAMAVKNNLPVAIHMRDAEEEMKEELQKMAVVPRGQFHCFDGSEEFLKRVISLGFYVSFGGNITYKSAINRRELLKKVPLDRLLLETDSPYLPPEPLRGTVNTPTNVKITAEFIAQELKIDLPELAKITTQNARCLYSLDI